MTHKTVGCPNCVDAHQALDDALTRLDAYIESQKKTVDLSAGLELLDIRAKLADAHEAIRRATQV